MSTKEMDINGQDDTSTRKRASERATEWGWLMGVGTVREKKTLTMLAPRL